MSNIVYLLSVYEANDKSRVEPHALSLLLELLLQKAHIFL